MTDRQGAVPAGGVGDGGASWRMKALRRAQVRGRAWEYHPTRRSTAAGCDGLRRLITTAETLTVSQAGGRVLHPVARTWRCATPEKARGGRMPHSCGVSFAYAVAAQCWPLHEARHECPSPVIGFRRPRRPWRLRTAAR